MEFYYKLMFINKGNNVDKHLCFLYSKCCKTYYNKKQETFFQVIVYPQLEVLKEPTID